MRRSFSFTNVSQYLSANGIKTSIATVAAAVTYSGAALNGGLVTAGTATPAPNSHTGLAMVPSATASSSAGSYVAGSRIRFIGKWGTNPRAERVATVVGTDGNATFLADGPLETVVEIQVEAQANTSGAWTFGFNGIGVKPGHRIVAVRGQGAGNLVLDYGPGYTTDTVVTAVGQLDEVTPMAIRGTSSAICTVFVES